jgi:fermentation-respiration switch protein FrsA (DUF1100 family)
VSTLIGALWCRKKCNASELAGEFAYFPPSPPSYIITRGADGRLACALNSFYFHARHSMSLTRTQAEVVELSSGRGVEKTKTPALFFTHAEARLTLLFSHSNAVDLGFLYRFFDELTNRLHVNVFAYEFSGYGPTLMSATPRNHTQCADIEAAYEFLLDRKLDPARQVIAYGQSIGSYPTLYLASTRRLLGVVLHSPIAAGLQVIAQVEGCCAPHVVFACLEPYPNTRLVKRSDPARASSDVLACRAAARPARSSARARDSPAILRRLSYSPLSSPPPARASTPPRRLRDPVLVIHGSADETVDVAHGQALYAACGADSKYEPYWVQGATHEDVIEVDERAYFRRLVAFFDHCERRHASSARSPTSSAGGEGLPLNRSRDSLVRQDVVARPGRWWDMRPVPDPSSVATDAPRFPRRPTPRRGTLDADGGNGRAPHALGGGTAVGADDGLAPVLQPSEDDADFAGAGGRAHESGLNEHSRRATIEPAHAHPSRHAVMPAVAPPMPDAPLAQRLPRGVEGEQAAGDSKPPQASGPQGAGGQAAGLQGAGPMGGASGLASPVAFTQGSTAGRSSRSAHTDDSRLHSIGQGALSPHAAPLASPAQVAVQIAEPLGVDGHVGGAALVSAAQPAALGASALAASLAVLGDGAHSPGAGSSSGGLEATSVHRC